jgi:uncharacterized protein YbjQ (UPF0145 family)
MILASTEAVAGREAVECLGIVTAEAIIAPTTAQAFALTQETQLQVRQQLLFDARERALDELASIATARGANAVVGIRLDYEQLDGAQGFLLASAVGTAVRLAEV